MEQLREWFNGGAHGDGVGKGVICFDESHKSKNLFPRDLSLEPDDGGRPQKEPSTATGLAVQALQAGCKDARLVYASATAASP